MTGREGDGGGGGGGIGGADKDDDDNGVGADRRDGSNTDTVVEGTCRT